MSAIVRRVLLSAVIAVFAIALTIPGTTSCPGYLSHPYALSVCRLT